MSLYSFEMANQDCEKRNHLLQRLVKTVNGCIIAIEQEKVGMSGRSAYHKIFVDGVEVDHISGFFGWHGAWASYLKISKAARPIPLPVGL